MEIEVGDIKADIVFKDIKNVHLSVHPPDGRVTISAPERMELEAVRLFSVSKLAWIKKQQRALRAQDRETPREYIAGESHYLWGQRYLLDVRETTGRVGVEVSASKMRLLVRPGASTGRREAVMARWYRDEIRRVLPALLSIWHKRLDVRGPETFVQHMKTRWGSCNPVTRNIRLNTELAKKPRECLEYILVHELIHLKERKHTERFVKLMDDAMPNWRSLRNRLNNLPVRHEDWKY